MTSDQRIILIVDDLMFLPRLQTGLAQLGYVPLPATDEARLTQALFQSPVLVIVDLFSRSFDWEALVRLVKKSKAGPVPVLGFGPHVDLQLRQRALAAGCAAVVGRSAVASQLPHLVEKHRWVLDKTPCTAEPPPLVRQGIELFNRGQFFACHEVLEDAWNQEAGPVRILYQGILQVGVACYHVQQNNPRGAQKVLHRAIPKLRRFAPVCMGIDLTRLLADAGQMQRCLHAAQPVTFPTIHLAR